MVVRIDPDLKAKVNNFAKVEGKSVSEVVRELLAGYVKDRDAGAYIDDLWDRIGGNLASKGRKPGDVKTAIRKSRSKK